MANIEKLKAEILHGEIFNYDELPARLQRGREITLQLVLNSDNKALLEMSNDCTWRKDDEVVMAGTERYLMNLGANEVADQVTAYCLANVSFHQDENLVKRIGGGAL